MTYRYGVSHAALVASAFLIEGCFPIGTSETESYRAALPLKESVTLGGPESGATSAAADPSSGAEAPPGAPISKYYAFTRQIRDGVNRVTASVLGTVWYIVNTHPSDIHDDEATWGPYSDALEPATWRFRVTRIAGQKYGYVLEGRPRGSNDEGDYRVVLDGTGYGRDDDRHGDGTFSVDLDAAKALDPVAHADDSGTISVVHDLPKTVTEEFAPLPRRIEVDLAASDSGSALTISSLARLDSTGQLSVTGLADMDESHATALEDLSIFSQWTAAGAGRADISITGGDVPTALDPLNAVECWDTHFKQSYYVDSAGSIASVGAASNCAFSAAATVD